jgi:hypothetical protein
MTEPIDEAVWLMTDEEYAIWLENELVSRTNTHSDLETTIFS